MANVKEIAFEQAEKIYQVISNGTFATWYGPNTDPIFDDSDFGRHLLNDEDAKDKDQILADIIRIFQLPI